MDLTITHTTAAGSGGATSRGRGISDFEPTGMIRDASRRQAMIDMDRDGRVDWLHGGSAGIHFNLADGKDGFVAEQPRPLAAAPAKTSALPAAGHRRRRAN